MMKKITIAVVGFLAVTINLKAQTIQEGVNHLYADRTKSAVLLFEKLIAANPNNLEAIYWLGQTYLDEKMTNKARELYDKALVSSNNAPLLIVGRGQLDLIDKKNAEAKQKFETALTMTKGKKGDDPQILNAVGRANVNVKDGDIAYAIQKLEAAVLRDEKNPDIHLNLGNAYRKLKDASGGSQAYTNYTQALKLNSAFAIAYVRLAKLFETQRNNEVYLDNLNKAIEVDSKFSPAYYELYYFYFDRRKFDQASDYLTKYIESKKPETYIDDQRLFADLCWAKADFDCAISKANDVLAKRGDAVDPKVLKLLAYSYFGKQNFPDAKKAIDSYFAKQVPEEVLAPDYSLEADIYSKIPGEEGKLFDIYLAGAKADTVVDNKIELLSKGAKYFKEIKQRDKEGELLAMILSIKPNPIYHDYYYTATAFYFGKMYEKSRDFAVQLREKFPEEVYGYEWSFNNSVVLDTVRKDSIAVPDALALYQFAQKDTAKFKSKYLNSVRFLAGYYFNGKEKEKALEFLQKWKEVEPSNVTTIDSYIDQAKKLTSSVNKASGSKDEAAIIIKREMLVAKANKPARRDIVSV